MDSLADTSWDAVIEGTGLVQSLLALALSRSGKKILHVDHDEYYGGDEAALSLQEIDHWVRRHRDGPTGDQTPFSNAVISPGAGGAEHLSFSRAYSLSLTPQIVYCSSAFLRSLVSSQVYRQLEFLAVGSWWILDPAKSQDATSAPTTRPSWNLVKIPSGREDIFENDTFSLADKRSLMKFLRFVQDYENQRALWQPYDTSPFPDFAGSEHFRLPDILQKAIFAITGSALPMQETETGWAIETIARHLRSFGIFGSNVGSVVAKWGGLGEICQVACRACAVGGGTYVLGQGIEQVDDSGSELDVEVRPKTRVRLDGGDTITTRHLIRSEQLHGPTMEVFHLVSIVDSRLEHLLPSLGDQSPTSAVAIVVVPAGVDPRKPTEPPIYIQVHSSETGECPRGQTVLYASTLSSPDACAAAVAALLEALPPTQSPSSLSLEPRTSNPTPAADKPRSIDTSERPATDSGPSGRPAILWSLSYSRQHPSYRQGAGGDEIGIALTDDPVLSPVLAGWERVMADEIAQGTAGGFMDFEDRNPSAADAPEGEQ